MLSRIKNLQLLSAILVILFGWYLPLLAVASNSEAETLVVTIRDFDLDAAQAAVETLSGHETLPQEVISSLVKLVLEDPRDEMRSPVATLLGDKAREASLPGIVAGASDGEWTVRDAALSALGEMKAREALDTIAGLRSDPHWWLRIRAYNLLAELGGDRAEALVTPGLADSHRMVRLFAATNLGRCCWGAGQGSKQDSSPEKLVNQLSTGSAENRRSIALQIRDLDTGDINDALVAALEAGAKDQDKWLSFLSLQTLKALKEKGVAISIKPFIDALDTDDEDVRWSAALALRSLATDIGVDIHNRLAGSGDPQIRGLSIKGLEAWRDDESLKRLLNDEDRTVRTAAAIALGRLGDAIAVPHLEMALRDRGPGYFFYPLLDPAAESAQQLGELESISSIPVLLQALQSRDARLRLKVLEALAELKEKEALPMLLEMLSSNSVSDQVYAAMALGKIGDPIAIQPLSALLTSPFVILRGVAVGALGDIGTLPGIAGVISMTSDPNKEVRKEAYRVLSGLKVELPKAAVEQLIDILLHQHSELENSAVGQFLSQVPRELLVQRSRQLLDAGDKQVADQAAYLLAFFAGKGETERVWQYIDRSKWAEKDLSLKNIYTLAGLAVQGELRGFDLTIAQQERDTKGKNWKKLARLHRDVMGLLSSQQKKRLVAHYGKVIDDSSSRNRNRAVGYLGKLGIVEAVPLLKAALNDKKLESGAAKALADIGGVEAAEALKARAIEEPRSKAMSYWITALEKEAGDSALVDFLGWLLTQEGEVRDWKRLGDLIAQQKSEIFEESLDKLHTHSNLILRRIAILAIGERGESAYLPQLLSALEDSDKRNRAYALKSLGRIRTNKGNPLLIALLGDSNPKISDQAFSALRDAKGIENLGPLIELSRHSEPRIQIHALSVLANQPQASIDPVVEKRFSELLQSSDAFFKGAVLESFGTLYSDSRAGSVRKRFREQLEAGLVDPVADFRAITVSVLGKLYAKESLPVILPLLADPEEWPVKDVIGVLENLGVTTESLPGLERSLAHPDPSVRKRAATLLAEFDDKQATGFLGKQLSDVDEGVRTNAAELISRFRLKALAGQLSSAEIPDKLLLSTLDALGESDRFAGRVGAAGKYTLAGFLKDQRRYSKRVMVTVAALADEESWRFRLKLPEKLLASASGVSASSFTAERLEEDIAYVEKLRGISASTPYLYLYGAQLLFDKGRDGDALGLADKGLALVDARRSLPLYLSLGRLKAELLWRLNRNDEALMLLESLLRESVPLLSAAEKLEGEFSLESEILALKGIVMSSSSRPGDAVLTLFKAEEVLQGSVTADDDVRKRLRQVILAYRAQALRKGAKKDADKALELGETVEAGGVVSRLQQSAEEVAMVTRIKLATGDGDYELAHQLTEKLLLKRQSWKGESLKTGAPHRGAALDEVGRLRQQVASLNSAIEQARSKDEDNKVTLPGKDGKALKKLKKQRKRAQRKLKRFIVSLKQAHPEVAALVGAEPAEMGAIQERLAEGQVLLQYLLLEEQGYIFLISVDDVVIEEIPVGRNVIGPWVTAFRSGFQQAVADSEQRGQVITLGPGKDRKRISPAEAGKALAENLIAPISEELAEYTRVIIIPNGPLHQLPFAALPWKGGYLMSQYRLSRLSAASLVAATAEEGGSGKLLALAVPEREGWAPLTNVEREVESISSHYSEKQVYVGSDAHKGKLIGQDLRGWQLHFATHGKAGSVGDTRLVLSDDDLVVDEIWGLYLDGSPLVVLSACETSLGESVSGDEVVSLANGFLFAGARNVISSLWQVPDAPTQRLMTLFYSELAKSHDPVLAMNRSQLAMHAEGYPPYAWAGFNVTGTGSSE